MAASRRRGSLSGRSIRSSNRSRSARRTSGGRSSAGKSRSSGRTFRSAKPITDHDKIRDWVEARGGHPATVKRTTRGNEPAGIIRIDFPGFSGERSLKPISWDEWFDIFEERRLAFLKQNKTATGKPSRFNKLVCRED